MKFPFMFVEVADAPIIEGRSGVSPKTNKPYDIPSKQTAALHYGAAFAHPFEIAIPKAKSPYKPGFYILAGSESVRPGQYGPSIDPSRAELVSFDEVLEQLTKANPKLKAA